ncbi:uncharacterized protein LOC106463955 isoform X2 [Limulus polyphemus]|uniref:Uncharacterized protein LOC106463955 isoform X2 n=1 Tax=Limulus polyphemus TaxID=6850 RepID=A0ABM1SUJ5_LIMPO|nr:uncharacterized protein LOC106463955 isoform X2 [Limulus polyphemus]
MSNKDHMNSLPKEEIETDIQYEKSKSVSEENKNLGLTGDNATVLAPLLEVRNEQLNAQLTPTHNYGFYTPQNSYVDTYLYNNHKESSDPFLVLPHIDSQEMVRKVIKKREQLKDSDEATAISSGLHIPQNTVMKNIVNSYGSETVTNTELLSDNVLHQGEIANIQDVQETKGSLNNNLTNISNACSRCEPLMSESLEKENKCHSFLLSENTLDDEMVKSGDYDSENAQNMEVGFKSDEAGDSGYIDVSGSEASPISPLSPDDQILIHKPETSILVDDKVSTKKQLGEFFSDLWNENKDYNLKKTDKVVNVEKDKTIIHGRLSPDDSDTAKDRGTEKEKLGEKDSNNAKIAISKDKKNDFDIHPYIYPSETVEFPDSPQHLNLVKEKFKESMDNMDDEEEVKMLGSENSRNDSSLMTEDSTYCEGFSLNTEEYFEDNLMTSHISTPPYSIEHKDSGPGSLNFFGSKEMQPRHINSQSEAFDMFPSISDMPSTDQSFSNDTLGLDQSLSTEISGLSFDSPFVPEMVHNHHQNPTSSTPLCEDPICNRIKSTSPYDVFTISEETFDSLVSEGIPGDEAPDVCLLQKLKTCFDQERIKDIYTLSGRLQDILSPVEIEEILSHTSVYCKFIKDEVFEVLSLAHSEMISGNFNEKSSGEELNNAVVQDTTEVKNVNLNVGLENMEVSKETCFVNDKNNPVFPPDEIPDCQNLIKDKHFSLKDLSERDNSIQSSSEQGSLKKDTSSSTDKYQFFKEENNSKYNEEDSPLPVNYYSKNKVPKTSLVLKVGLLEENAMKERKHHSSKVTIVNPDGSITSSLVTSNANNETYNAGSKDANEANTGLNLCEEENVKDNYRCSSGEEGFKSGLNSNLEAGNDAEERITGSSTSLKESGHCEEADTYHGTGQSDRPSSLTFDDNTFKRKKIAFRYLDLIAGNDEDQKSFSSTSNKSDIDPMSPVDDLETPDDLDENIFEDEEKETKIIDPIPEISAAEELEEERRWRSCWIGGIEKKIDMKVIQPYKNVLSHGGYFGPSRNAIIVFSACYLPDHSRQDYSYVMDNLFMYLVTTLDELVAEDYVLIYLHGATQRNNLPTFGWLKRCYYMIDRKLRKNLKRLYIVHPTFWVKALVLMIKPFISSKFSRKLEFVHSLKDLSIIIPVDSVCIPDKVKQFDEESADGGHKLLEQVRV